TAYAAVTTSSCISVVERFDIGRGLPAARSACRPTRLGVAAERQAAGRFSAGFASRRVPRGREPPGVECRIVRIDFGDVVVDTRTRELTRAGQPVPLSPKAFELLLLLIESRPRALSQPALQDRL